MDAIRFLNLRYFFNQVLNILSGNLGFGELSLADRLIKLWEFMVPYLKVWSTYLSLILLVWLIYSYIRLKQIQRDEQERFNNRYEPDDIDIPQRTEWKRILALSLSENMNDWKQAIIEADVILDRIVSAQGYHGATLGEKMKGIEKSDFTTLDSAWEAHKVRNRIAHDGGDFILTQREAKRVIGLFEAVFQEAGFI